MRFVEPARPLALLTPIFAAITASTIVQLPLFLVAVLAVQINAEVGLPPSGLGILVATFYSASALCTTSLGNLADRIGGSVIMRWGILPTMIALLLAAVGVRQWWQLIGVLAIAGLANGAIQPAANKYLTSAIDMTRQGSAFGIKQAAHPAAALLSGLSVPAVAHTLGWRWAFIAACLLSCLAAIYLKFRCAEDPLAPLRAKAAAPSQPHRFATKALIVLGIGVAVGAGAANSISSYFVLSAHDIGMTDSTAGWAVVGASLTCMIIRITVGRVADQLRNGHLYLVTGMCLIGAVGPLLLALGQPALLIPAALLGYGVAGGWTGLLNYAVAQSHPESAGRATGLAGGLGGSFGGGLMPLLFGYLIDRSGFTVAWLFAAGLLGAAASVFPVGDRMLRAKSR